MHIEQTDETRGLIIGAPLLLVAAFCFALVMIHPMNSGATKSANANDTSVTKKPAQTASFSVHELKLLPLAQTNSTNLSSPMPIGDSSSVGSPTASPQSVASGAQSTGAMSASSPSVNTYTANRLRVTSDSNGGGLIRTVLHGVINGL